MALYLGLSFIIGAVVGILLTFSSIRFAMVLPHFGAPKQPKEKKTVIKTPPKRRWDPRLIDPPKYFVSSSDVGGPGAILDEIEYESPLEYVSDPVDPKKEAKR